MSLRPLLVTSLFGAALTLVACADFRGGNVVDPDGGLDGAAGDSGTPASCTQVGGYCPARGMGCGAGYAGDPTRAVCSPNPAGNALTPCCVPTATLRDGGFGADGGAPTACQRAGGYCLAGATCNAGFQKDEGTLSCPPGGGWWRQRPLLRSGPVGPLGQVHPGRGRTPSSHGPRPRHHAARRVWLRMHRRRVARPLPGGARRLAQATRRHQRRWCPVRVRELRDRKPGHHR
jgi:hypothetical protein